MWKPLKYLPKNWCFQHIGKIHENYIWVRSFCNTDANCQYVVLLKINSIVNNFQWFWLVLSIFKQFIKIRSPHGEVFRKTSTNSQEFCKSQESAEKILEDFLWTSSVETCLQLAAWLKQCRETFLNELILTKS